MQIMSQRLNQLTINLWVGLITVLITINAFFVKRLVDKLDSTEAQVYALREDVASIKTRLDDILASRVLPSSHPWKKASLFGDTD